MTIAELQNDVWESLPPLRKRLAGRQTVDDFVLLAIENWEGEYLAACSDNAQQGVFATALLGHMKRCHQATSEYDAREYGFIWVFLLQALATAAIQYLIKWWLERRANRVMMEAWKVELTR